MRRTKELHQRTSLKSCSIKMGDLNDKAKVVLPSLVFSQVTFIKMETHIYSIPDL